MADPFADNLSFLSVASAIVSQPLSVAQKILTRGNQDEDEEVGLPSAFLSEGEVWEGGDLSFMAPGVTNFDLGHQGRNGPAKGQTRQATLANKRAAGIPAFFASVPSVSSVSAAKTITEGGVLSITVKLSAPPSKTQAFAYSYSGPAIPNFAFGTQTYTKGVTASANYLYVPAGVGSFTITIPIVHDSYWGVNNNLIITIGGKTSSVFVVDDFANVKAVFNGLGAAIKDGNARAVYNKSVAAAGLKRVDKQLLGTMPMAWFVPYIDAESTAIYNAKKSKTVNDFFADCIISTSDYRLAKINALIADFNAVGKIFTNQNFQPSFNPSTLITEVNSYLGYVINNVNSGLLQIMRLWSAYVFLINSVNGHGSQDEVAWFSARFNGSIHQAAYNASAKIDLYTQNVTAQLEKVKLLGNKELASNGVIDIQPLISNGLSIASSLGSASFFVSNLLTLGDNIGTAAASPNSWTAFYKSVVSSGILNSAQTGYMSLNTGATAQLIHDNLKSVGNFSYDNFAKIQGMASSLPARLAEVTNNETNYQIQFSDVLHYLLLQGGAGPDDVRIDDRSFIIRQDTTTFVYEKDYTYAWWGIPDDAPPPSSEIHQSLWGIPNSKLPLNYKSRILVPVVLDLTGEGLNFSSLERGVRFDADHDGVRDRVAWVKGGTALLAYDKDGDGDLSQTDEISFASYVPGAKTDLEGLAAFDTNGDHVLDARDALWNRFGVWQDVNHDGLVQADEFKSVAAQGIVALSLVSDNKASHEGDLWLYGRTTFTRADGSLGVAGDAGFRFAQAA